MQMVPRETGVRLKLKCVGADEAIANDARNDQIRRNNRNAIDTDRHNFGKGLNLKRFDVTLCRCCYPADRRILLSVASLLLILYVLEQLLRCHYDLPYGIGDVEDEPSFQDLGGDGSLVLNRNLLFMLAGMLLGTRLASLILTRS